jgi:hypothetical protein
MQYFHRYVSQYVVGIAAELEFKKGEEPAKGKGRGFLKSAEWLQAEGKGRKDTSKFRIGGLGTVMAISSGKTMITGTIAMMVCIDTILYSFVANVLAEHHYTTIFVIGSAALLHLPGRGYCIKVKPGDAIVFLASDNLHKLESDPNEPAASMFVITIWTDNLTAKRATEYKKSHHA